MAEPSSIQQIFLFEINFALVWRAHCHLSPVPWCNLVLQRAQEGQRGRVWLSLKAGRGQPMFRFHILPTLLPLCSWAPHWEGVKSDPILPRLMGCTSSIACSPNPPKSILSRQPEKPKPALDWQEGASFEVRVENEVKPRQGPLGSIWRLPLPQQGLIQLWGGNSCCGEERRGQCQARGNLVVWASAFPKKEPLEWRIRAEIKQNLEISSRTGQWISLCPPLSFPYTALGKTGRKM